MSSMVNDLNNFLQLAEEALWDMEDSLLNIKRQQQNSISSSGYGRFHETLEKWGDNLAYFSTMLTQLVDGKHLNESEAKSKTKDMEKCEKQLEKLKDILNNFNIT